MQSRKRRGRGLALFFLSVLFAWRRITLLRRRITLRRRRIALRRRIIPRRRRIAARCLVFRRIISPRRRIAARCRAFLSPLRTVERWFAAPTLLLLWRIVVSRSKDRRRILTWNACRFSLFVISRSDDRWRILTRLLGPLRLVVSRSEDGRTIHSSGSRLLAGRFLARRPLDRNAVSEDPRLPQFRVHRSFRSTFAGTCARSHRFRFACGTHGSDRAATFLVHFLDRRQDGRRFTRIGSL